MDLLHHLVVYTGKFVSLPICLSFYVSGCYLVCLLVFQSVFLHACNKVNRDSCMKDPWGQCPSPSLEHCRVLLLVSSTYPSHRLHSISFLSPAAFCSFLGLNQDLCVPIPEVLQPLRHQRHRSRSTQTVHPGLHRERITLRLCPCSSAGRQALKTFNQSNSIYSAEVPICLHVMLTHNITTL